MKTVLLTLIFPVVALIVYSWGNGKKGKHTSKAPSPEGSVLSVNWHFLRECNYACKFCFHTKIASSLRKPLPKEDAQRGLAELRQSGMKKINFSGGEPFLHEKYLGEMVRFCKEELRLESVSIVSNGSLIKKDWFDQYGQFVDVLAISCDSASAETNSKIGRKPSKAYSESQTEVVARVSALCRDHGIKFKLNTVVNASNYAEDMTELVTAAKPMRWKVFQCLLIEGENVGESALRDARSLVVSNEQFQEFVARHKDRVPCPLVPESNDDMRNSYLILDERMRFLDNTKGRKDPTDSILDVGVAGALPGSGFDRAAFLRRGGRYKWSRDPQSLEW